MSRPETEVIAELERIGVATGSVKIDGLAALLLQGESVDFGLAGGGRAILLTGLRVVCLGDGDHEGQGVELPKEVYGLYPSHFWWRDIDRVEFNVGDRRICFCPLQSGDRWLSVHMEGIERSPDPMRRHSSHCWIGRKNG